MPRWSTAIKSLRAPGALDGATVIAFFVVGFVILLAVDEKRGMEAAKA